MHLWHAHVCAWQPTCVHLAQSCTHAHAGTRLCAHAPRARPCCVHATPSCRHVARRVLLAAALRPQPLLSPSPRAFPLLRGSAPGWLALFQGLGSMGGRPFRGSEAWEMFIGRPRRGWRAAIWERQRARAAQHSQTSGSKGQSGEGGAGGRGKATACKHAAKKTLPFTAPNPQCRAEPVGHLWFPHPEDLGGLTDAPRSGHRAGNNPSGVHLWVCKL